MVINNKAEVSLKDSLLKKVKQEEIMQRYFPKVIEISKQYVNPYRKVGIDRNPGCKFYYNNDNVLIFKDFADDKYSGDCFQMAKNYYEHKHDRVYTFFEVLKYIERSFQINTTNLKLIKSINEDKEDKPSISNKKFKLKIIPTCRLLHNTTEELYLIKLLGDAYYRKIKNAVKTAYNVTFEYYDENNEKKFTKQLRSVDGTNPVFVFQYSPEHFHIYLPFNKTLDKNGKIIKHRKNVTFDMWYDNFSKSTNPVIITKSPIDAEIWGSFGFRALSPASEHVTKFPEKIFKFLKDKDVFLNYDPDPTGYKSMSRIIEQYDDHMNLNYLLFPEKEKDLKGYVLEHGREKTYNYINEILKKNDSAQPV
jgi:hypothetical protein